MANGRSNNVDLNSIIQELQKILTALQEFNGTSDDSTQSRHSNYETNDERENAFKKFKDKSSRKDTNANIIRPDSSYNSNQYNSRALNYGETPQQEQEIVSKKRICFIYNADGKITSHQDDKYSVAVPSQSGVMNFYIPNVPGITDEKLKNSPFFKTAVFSILSKNSINSDGILFMNLANPTETFEQCVGRYIQKYISKKEEEERRKAEAEQKKEAEKQRLEEEKRLKEEEERRNAEPPKPTMGQVFEIVAAQRRLGTPYYCMFNSNTQRFDYTSYAGAAYIVYTDQNARRIILPNQTSTFNTSGSIIPAVYKCSEPVVDEELRLIEPCLVDDDLRIVQPGIIAI